MTPADRYRAAYLAYLRDTAKTFYEMSGGEKMRVTVPPVSKANGLTKFICNYLTWMGHRATRVNTTGRLIDGKQRQESGAVLTVKKWIKGTTRKGSADISSTIRVPLPTIQGFGNKPIIRHMGLSVMWEVKIGRDRPSEHQLKEQALERKAGGEYFFTSTPEQFFEQYDGLFVS